VTAHLDDQSWLDKISNEYGDQSLLVLARLLQIACYILVSFYSGMRDSEVKHLNRGCLRIERDAEGTAYRWKVAACAFKGERDRRVLQRSGSSGNPPGGPSESWRHSNRHTPESCSRRCPTGSAGLITTLVAH
jgi:hypothetical protein